MGRGVGVHVRKVWGDSADGLQALGPYDMHLQGERTHVTAGNHMSVISDSNRVVVFRG